MIYADLHIHSKYSRACSKDLSFENLYRFGRKKGLNLIGTGDFTHPKQFSEINKLNEQDGILRYKDMHFMFQTEISLIYSQDSKVRKVHLLVLAPDTTKADEINKFLSHKGNLKADGRPIIRSYPAPEFTDDMMTLDNKIEIIPAHIWTPWFGVFGSKSGFDSLKEAFGERARDIHAIETGLSSDPAMNWRIKELREKTILSNSDAHSFYPWRIGREATLFNFKEDDLSYDRIIHAIRHNKINSTIEVDPAYGKYYFDGHRNCGVSMSPRESAKNNNLCPVCKKKLTLGVLNRVDELSDISEEKAKNQSFENKKPFYTLLPLSEIISTAISKGINTVTVNRIYNKLISEFETEYNVLLKADIDKIKRLTDQNISELIKNNREGKIKVKAGYDGVYGEINKQEKENKLSNYF